MIDRLEAIAAGDAAPPAKLREMLIARVMFRFDSVQHYTESISEVLRDMRSAVLERRERYFEQEAEMICATCCRRASGTRVFRRQDRDATRRARWSRRRIPSCPFNLSTRELGKRRDVEQAVTAIADMLLNGL